MPMTQEDLAQYQDCKSLTLEAFENLNVLQEHQDIEALYLTHWYKIESLDLEPLALLQNLKYLYLGTSTSWDGTNKTLSVHSFEPIASLGALEMVQIIGVIPQIGRLSPFAQLPSLVKISVGNTNFYQLEDFAQLSHSSPGLKGLAPITEMNFSTRCAKCQSKLQLYLEGAKPRARKYVCPKCNIKLIRKHLHRWNEAGGMPCYDRVDQLSAEELIQLFSNKNKTN